MFRIFVSGARTSSFCAAVLIDLVFTGVGRAAPNPACTVQVLAGQSIQAAIDGAPPRAVVCVGPGTYHENLLIAKDAITLQGAGPGKTVLEPPAQPVNVCLQFFFPPVDLEQTGLNGICVANVDSQGNRVATVSDVRVTGFTVRDFPGVGIVFAYTDRPRADHNAAANNGGYGITAFASTHGRFEDNTSDGSGDAGIYLGDSPHADFTIKDNTVTAALFGILVRDSSKARVTGNTLHDNCAGLVFLNTGTLSGVGHVVATGNTAIHNDNLCPGDELPFTLTGLGILIAGGDHIVLQGNTVRANQPGGAPSIVDGVALAGGIVVVSTQNVSVFGPPYFGSAATHNTIVQNTALDNQPFDLADDGLGTGNHFPSNTCGTSMPPGLCR
jgi:parallel beta-helix repeat protein